jgi:hypothetical protein
MNHVLKLAPADRAAQQQANSDPNTPLAPGLVDAMVAFVRSQRATSFPRVQPKKEE